YIEIPVLGRVVARQKTTYELAREIANGLREQEYLRTPNVVVNVRQYNSWAFFIQGAVHRPGLYQFENRPSLLTMISVARRVVVSVRELIRRIARSARLHCLHASPQKNSQKALRQSKFEGTRPTMGSNTTTNTRPRSASTTSGNRFRLGNRRGLRADQS